MLQGLGQCLKRFEKDENEGAYDCPLHILVGREVRIASWPVEVGSLAIAQQKRDAWAVLTVSCMAAIVASYQGRSSQVEYIIGIVGSSICCKGGYGLLRAMSCSIIAFIEGRAEESRAEQTLEF